MLKLNEHIVLNTLLLTIVLFGASIFSTAQVTEDTARKLFDEGKYSKALPHYNDLLTLYPNEYLFQYYYGVCLTETSQFGNPARKLLLQASQEDVPTNVLFYIGKNYHALNEFETALTYYARFDNYGKRKEKRSLNFQSIFDDCKNNINPFIIEEPKIIKETEKDIELEPYIEECTDITADAAYVIPPPVPDELTDTQFEFLLTRDIVYLNIGQFKTDEGKMWFTEGWKKSKELNNTLANVSRLRNEYYLAPTNEIRDSIANHLLKMEMSTLQLKNLSDENYLNAREAEMNFWNSAPESEVLLLIAENVSIIHANMQKKDKIVFNDIKEKELFNDENLEAVSDSVSNLTKVIENPKLADNKVIYKIQIGAFSRSLPDYIDRLYKKLSVLRRIETYTNEMGVAIYTIGELANYNDALRLQNQIRQEGVTDAFVVAFKNGKRITLNEAREITGQ